MKAHTTWLGLALAALHAAPAGAQLPMPNPGMSNPSQWYVNTQMYSTQVFNGMVANGMVAGSTPGAKRSGPADAAPEVTRFRESSAVSAVPALARRTGASPAAQEAARRTFESYVALYKETARKDGFASDDLAYAFEYFVVNNYHIYHDLMNVPYEKDPRARRGRDSFDRIAIMAEKQTLQVTMDQERTIVAQFRASLARNPQIRRMSDAEKQAAAEQLAIMFGVNYGAYMKAIDSGDDAALEEAHRMARQGLEKLLGVPVGRIRVTSAGLQF